MNVRIVSGKGHSSGGAGATALVPTTSSPRSTAGAAGRVADDDVRAEEFAGY
jgi:hypothetical protein